MSRFVCWAASQYVLAVSGADIGITGCWRTGEFEVFGMGLGGKGEVLMRRQWASSYGIHIIPYNRLQRYVTSIDLRSAVQDNVAFKISFGTTFALAAFMHF